jgi:hypothetical protein
MSSNRLGVTEIEIDLDLGDVKPIRVHPYRWSPAKVQAGRELVQEFIDDGIVRPITSEWGAPALLVAPRWAISASQCPR